MNNKFAFNKMTYNKFLFIFLTFFISPLASQSVIINEIMSSNISVLADEDGDFSDWIEILNPTDSTINLLNFSISDNSEFTEKWVFPEYFIAPNSYLIIFASGKDKIGSEFHTNFQLKSSGESLSLSDSTGQIIDNIDSVEIPTNISLGRGLIELSQWFFYTPASPGTENNTESYIGRSENPQFSLSSGFYDASILLNLSSSSQDTKIYYTLDGSEPNINSTIFVEDIEIDSTIVVRAKSFEAGLLSSKIITNTYFINENSSLSVVSISTDPKNLFDDEIGIYVEGTNGIPGNCSTDPKNWNRDWERPIHVEFFEENGDLGFGLDAGLKIHGGCTRNFSQKALSINARAVYGSKYIDYKLFPNLDFEKYYSFLLRNSGNDIFHSFIRDPLMHSIADNLDIEKQAYRPTILFINGKYWGLHNIREKIDKDYLHQHHRVDQNNLDLLRDTRTVMVGDGLNYNQLINFFRTNNLSLDSNYSKVSRMMEIDNYIDYMLAEMFYANDDWYPANTKFWRPKTDDGRWRWILFDTDRGFGLYNPNNVNTNMFDLVTDNTKYPSAIFNNLVNNENFRNKFLIAFSDYSNSIFQPDSLIKKINCFESLISNEIPRHIQRWRINGGTFEAWKSNVNELRDFANVRLPIMKEHLMSEFNLSVTSSLKIINHNPESSEIKLNSLTISKLPWSGSYFNSIPISLTIHTKPGYRFLGWKIADSLFSTEKNITLNLNSNIEIEALTELNSEGFKQVIINEINYNSSGENNCGDWIEILNISDTTVDISNWTIKDQKDSNNFIIPPETFLKKYGYLVICYDSLAFKTVFPNIKNVISGIDFKFSSNGEIIRLYNDYMYLIDSVRYSPHTPWPIEANGEGNTLELITPLSDNNLALNWQASVIKGGTPGSTNSTLIINKLFINELLAINDSNIVDDYGQYEDWIEIYNQGDFPISINNIFITDNLENMLKYKLGDGSDSLLIYPKEFLLFWADQEINQGIYHLNFKLSGSGEQIGISLYNGIKEIFIDSLSYHQQSSNESFGRFPDAYKRLMNFKDPTPLDFNSNLENHIPYFTKNINKEYLIKSDSLIVINIWDYVEDVETPDSLLKYNFEASSNSVDYNYYNKKGTLELYVRKSENVEEMLYISIEDQNELSITDTIKFLYPTITENKEYDILPTEYSLAQNYPNPFNPSTKIKFGLPKKSSVTLIVYNNLGEKIEQLINKQLKAGYYEVEFKNRKYSSGIYFYRVEADNFIEIKKMILLK